MGQYYRQAINYVGEVYYSNRKVKGEEYVMAKLMEHSYFGNYLMDGVAKILENYETRLAWIGDYADEDDEVKKITKGEATYDDCWGENAKTNFEFDKVKFNYKNKYLVNLDKKVYISFDKYLKNSHLDNVDEGWEINPISILTAIGNGRGGGDYEGTNMEYVGSWAWDKITISENEDIPEDFKEIELTFVEK